MKVELRGPLPLELAHASGELDDDKLGEAGILEHNGHIYLYSRLSKGVAVFHEARTPWNVTGLLTVPSVPGGQ